MPGNVTYLNRFPSWLVWNDTLIGYSGEGDIMVSFAQTWVEQKSHQTGDLTLQAYHKPGPVSVRASIAEIANWSNLLVLFPRGEKQIDDSTPPENRFTGDQTYSTTFPYAGTRATTVAQELRIIPETEYVAANSETTNQLVIPLAYVAEIGDFAYGLESDLAPEVTFKSLYDPSKTDGSNHWLWGKVTAAGGTWGPLP